MQENQQSLSRLSALSVEHRDVKNHWLAEKNDLQTRIFQVQALNTQAAGSLKKRDKDFGQQPETEPDQEQRRHRYFRHRL